MAETESTEVVLITLDRASGCAIFTRSDGKQARFPLVGSGFDSSSLLARIDWSPQASGLLATTLQGDSIYYELPVGNSHGLDGRVSVYLDQPHWSTFQKVASGRGGVHRADAEAAEQLAVWAEERRIVLPASAAHHHETTKWSNAEGRYLLGLHVLTHSRGWQLRDPLKVRRLELRQALSRAVGSSSPPPTSVITLQPGALHAGRGVSAVDPPADLPLDWQRLYVAVLAATVAIDVMMDSEAIPSTPATGWAQTQQRFSSWLAGEQRDAVQKRRSIDVMFLSDLRPELAEEAQAAGMTPDDLSAWVFGDWVSDVTELPSLGLYYELFQQRHLAASTWQPNDLTDMVYLACGAAYADFAVGERHMTSFLIQSLRRLNRQPNVFARLRDLMGPLGAEVERRASCGRSADSPGDAAR